MPTQQFFSYIMTRTSLIWWDGDDVHFVQDQYAKFDFYSASSLKQQSTGRHVAQLSGKFDKSGCKILLSVIYNIRSLFVRIVYVFLTPAPKYWFFLLKKNK
jgi:hypothetical protein